MEKETCTKHNLEAEGNCKKKGVYLECKPPFHLHIFPGPIKCKQLREAWIKAVRQEPFESVPFILLMDWQLMKIPYEPFSLVIKRKKSRITLLRKSSEIKM